LLVLVILAADRTRRAHVVFNSGLDADRANRTFAVLNFSPGG
jgi:hypothetical protein